MNNLTFITLFLFGLSLSKYVPVYVMLELDTLNNDNQMSNVNQFTSYMKQLKSGAVDGVMTDVWWGLVEKESPQSYDWSGYEQMFQIVEAAGLKLQVVMSFHRCGGNVGDACNIPLPPWVLDVGKTNPNIYYTSPQGNRDTEYLTSGIDNEPIFPSNTSTLRTGVNLYSDCIQSFKHKFGHYLGNLITLIEVGLGPAGEMRYPSYQLKYWKFPGVGEFQCNDTYLTAQLEKAVSDAGKPSSWAKTPSNAEWYADTLITHGANVLSEASKILQNLDVKIAAKISGVHWLYNTPSHAAELTAGYKNDLGKGYLPIATMFKKYGATFDFTCFEMLNSEQPPDCYCNPEQLVFQTLTAANTEHINYIGENALPRYDKTAYQTIEYESDRVMLVNGFTYLRLGTTLLESNNWSTFKTFVYNMHNLI